MFDKTFGNFINLCQICREALTGLLYTLTWTWLQVHQVESFSWQEINAGRGVIPLHSLLCNVSIKNMKKVLRFEWWILIIWDTVALGSN